MKKGTFATVYGVTSNGVCHGCIRYKDYKNVRNQSISGAMMVIEVKSLARKAGNIPVYDITNSTKILGLNETNMEKYNCKKIN